MFEIFNIYLPIADVNINFFLLLAVGLGSGLLSGMFGVGGSLVCIPALLYIGINPKIAVASVTNQMVAASFSGFLAYSERGRVDYKLGFAMVVGGLSATIAGIWFFDYMADAGHINSLVSIGLIVLLSLSSFLTARDALKMLYYKMQKREYVKSAKPSYFGKWFMPFKTSFISIKQPISIIGPILVGMTGGFLVSVMGVGGTLIMMPALLYLLRVSEMFTVGTCHFQLIFVTSLSTILHATTQQDIDIILSGILIFGTAFGARIGAQIVCKWSPDSFCILLAILIFSLCAEGVYKLVAKPNNLYHIEALD